MKHKSCTAQFKALDEDQGTFEAIVSVFGNVDHIGDRVVKGAFSKSLDQWNKSGDPIPVIWSHMWANPSAHIGKTISAVETEDGLLVKGQLDLDHPFAAKVYKLLKERRVKEFSFAYDVPEGGEKKADDGANDLLELELIEVGPTLKGMNPATQLIAAKAMLEEEDPTEALEKSVLNRWEKSAAKAGRVLSAKNETALRTAYETIGEVLKQLEEKPEEQKAVEQTEVAQEPTRAIASGRKDHLKLLLELEELEAAVS